MATPTDAELDRQHEEEIARGLAPALGWTGGPLPDDVVAALNEELDRSRVKSREGRGGGRFSYLEGHDVKRTLNRIFGYGNWGYRPLELVELSAVEVMSRYKKAGWHVGYRAVVELTIRGCIPVADVGYGDGVEYGWSEQDAGASRVTGQELAMKEAVTDGLKRAAVAYGDQFGLVLYEKDEGAAQQQRDQNADGARGRAAPSDTGMSIAACMEQLGAWVLDPVPWIREAYYKLHGEKLVGTERDMDGSRRIDMIGRLQNVVKFLDDTAPKGDDVTLESMQQAVRSGFAAAFDGLEVLGPDPFAPAIPF